VGKLDSADLVDIAYIWYRLSPSEGREPSSVYRFLEGALLPRIANRVEINFLGVFDTVGALGIPFQIPELAADLRLDIALTRHGLGSVLELAAAAETTIRQPIEGFHNTALGKHVKHAYHALSIDEQRGPFIPTLWTAAPATSTVEQAWFAGVHGDVGGSYHDRTDDARLADVPLLWMLEKATALGLDLVPGAIEALRASADALGPQHDSLTPGWEALFKVSPLDRISRPIGNSARKDLDPQKFPLVEANEKIHPSVHQRRGNTIEIRRKDGRTMSSRYDPPNLP
jgi:hypothetical protein